MQNPSKMKISYFNDMKNTYAFAIQHFHHHFGSRYSGIRE